MFERVTILAFVIYFGLKVTGHQIDATLEAVILAMVTCVIVERLKESGGHHE